MNSIWLNVHTILLMSQLFSLVYVVLMLIKAHFYDTSGYHSLIEEFVNSDSESHKNKKFLLRILDDVLKLDLPIEPSKVPGKNQAGICHWACIYNDLKVAKIIFKMKDFDINRIDVSHKIGVFRLIEKTDNDVVDMIELLIEKGLDINYRYDLKTNTLLESFILAIIIIKIIKL